MSPDVLVPHHCHEDPSCDLTYFEATSKGKKACEGDWRGEGLEIWHDEVSSGSTYARFDPHPVVECFGLGGRDQGGLALLESRP